MTAVGRFSGRRTSYFATVPAQKKTEFNVKWPCTEGHSRSRILGSVERRWVAKWLYNNVGLYCFLRFRRYRHFADNVITVWVYLRSNFRDGLRKKTCFEAECITAVQVHLISLIFDTTNRQHVCNFLLIINSNLLFCPLSEILQVFRGKELPTPIPPKFGECSP